MNEHAVNKTTLPLDERKFAQETADRKRELDIKEREITVKEQELKRMRSSSPIVITILVTIAGLTGTAVTAINNRSNLELESQKAQSAMILEAVKTGDERSACLNVLFLTDIGLLEDRNRVMHARCNQVVAQPIPTLPMTPGK